MQPRRKATLEKYAEIRKRWQQLYEGQKMRSEQVFTVLMAEFFISRRTVERVVHEWTDTTDDTSDTPT